MVSAVSVTEVCEHAFSDCRNLRKVEMKLSFCFGEDINK